MNQHHRHGFSRPDGTDVAVTLHDFFDEDGLHISRSVDLRVWSKGKATDRGFSLGVGQVEDLLRSLQACSADHQETQPLLRNEVSMFG